MLNAIADRIICVRGNCDGEVDDMVLDFPVLADYAIIYSDDLEGRMIFATHGHHYNAQNLPKLKQGDILMHGHTHIPCLEEHNGITVTNPGSVSIPKNGSEHSYMLLDSGKLIRKSLDGSVLETHQIV